MAVGSKFILRKIWSTSRRNALPVPFSKLTNPQILPLDLDGYLHEAVTSHLSFKPRLQPQAGERVESSKVERHDFRDLGSIESKG